MTEKEMETKIIKTQDENGDFHSFELLDVVNMDDQDYGLLVYLNEDEQPEDDEEVLIMKIHEEDEGEGYTFETIDDDEEFNKVVELLEPEEEDEEEE